MNTQLERTFFPSSHSSPYESFTHVCHANKLPSNISSQDSDPTNGYVTYVDESTAESAGLIYASGNATYIGVDTTNVASGSGRQSVRLTSNTAYTHGLFVLDLAHMPGSVCGSWPAL
jgi:hypothetical protein